MWKGDNCVAMVVFVIGAYDPAFNGASAEFGVMLAEDIVVQNGSLD